MAPSPLTPKLFERIESIEAHQGETLEVMRQLRRLVEEMGLLIASQESMKERERFVSEAEERIFEETNRLETERAELDQMRADMNPPDLKVVGQ